MLGVLSGMGAPEAEAGPSMTGNTANKAMTFTNFNRKIVKTGRWAVPGKGSEVPWGKHSTGLGTHTTQYTTWRY